MSDLKAQKGEPIAADKWNSAMDLLASQNFDAGTRARFHIKLVRTLEAIAAATVDGSDTADSVYNSGEVQTFGLKNNGDGTFEPVLSNKNQIMINAGLEEIPSGTELWAMDYGDGVLISTVWPC